MTDCKMIRGEMREKQMALEQGVVVTGGNRS